MSTTAKTLDEANEQIAALRSTNRRLHVNAAIKLRSERARLREIIGWLAAHLEDECEVNLEDVLGDPALSIAQCEAERHREEYAAEPKRDPGYERGRLHALSDDAHEMRLESLRGDA